ncbi:MAG: VOC family protein [Myxococcales bacterium]|nr:VOC family protein [Myxococcales bacterium]
MGVEVSSRIGFAIPVLPVLDIGEAVTFYRERLGFEVLFEYPAYAGFARDGVQLHVWCTEDPALPRSTSCRFQVSGIDALDAELGARDVIHPNGALAEKPWGFRELTVLDLCGNCLVFAEPLA